MSCYLHLLFYVENYHIQALTAWFSSTRDWFENVPEWMMWGPGLPLLLMFMTLLLLQHEDGADELKTMGQFEGTTCLLLLLNKLENQPYSSLMMSQHG